MAKATKGIHRGSSYTAIVCCLGGLSQLTAAVTVLCKGQRSPNLPRLLGRKGAEAGFAHCAGGITASTTIAPSFRITAASKLLKQY